MPTNSHFSKENDYQFQPSSNKMEERLSKELKQRIIKELADAGVSEPAISEIITLALEDVTTSTTIMYPHGAVTIYVNVQQIRSSIFEDEVDSELGPGTYKILRSAYYSYCCEKIAKKL